MASLGVGPPSERLSIESIPAVDLRLLTQSELTALSLSSSHAFDLRRCDDLVIPKIDRSVFNESAGSRKQTYSRLRLAPRNKPNFSPKPNPDPPLLDSAERAENSRIVSIFKNLFHGGGFIDNNFNALVGVVSSRDERQLVDVSELALVPVSVEYCDTVPVPLHDGESILVEGNRKRKRGRKPKSETTTPTPTPTPIVVDCSNIHGDFTPSSSSLAMVVAEEEGIVEVEVKEETAENWEEKEKELVNKEGLVVDLGELAKKEDPYGEELRRRTEGKVSAEELLEFVGNLEGEWGSRRKKRKIVDANVFGDALPNGWKVLIAIKKKQRRAWVFCRRYISPNGRYFVSCKEVSSYLLSLNGLQESQAQDLENSVFENMASENAADISAKIECTALPTLSLTPRSSDLGSQQMQVCTSETPDPPKKLILSEDIHLGEVQLASGLKCHKCSSPFTEKGELLNHLVSCHKRKRRKPSTPVDDDILMKDGKYECQFCNKLFVERNSYFGHVGIHVKNYVKSIGGTQGLPSKQESFDLGPVEDAPVTTSDALETVEHTLASRELNSSLDAKEKAPNVERHVVSVSCTSDPNTASQHAELAPAQIDRSSAGEKNQMEVDYASDRSAGKPDYSSGSDKALCNSGDDLYNISCELNATESLRSKISRSPPVVVENSEASSHSDDELADTGEEVNFVEGNSLNEEYLAYYNGLPTDHKEILLSSGQNSADGSVGSEALEPNHFHEGAKVAGNDQLLDGCDSGHPALGMDAEDILQHTGRLEECSAVSEAEDRCGVTENKKEHMGSPVTDSKLERGSDTRFFSAGHPTIGLQPNDGQDFTGLMDETEVDLCNFGSTEVSFNTEKCITQSRHSKDSMLLLNKDTGSDYFQNEAHRDSRVQMLQSTGTGGFQAEQTCSSDNSLRDGLDRDGVELKNDQVVSNLFFTSGRTDLHLVANDMANNGQENNNVSHTLGAFNSFVKDKQEQVPRNMLSGLSMNDNSNEVDINNVMHVSSTTTTMQLPELNKVESPRANNKLMFDFGSMTDMNASFLSSVQHEVVSEASPFHLWGQQSCGLEDNQSKVYGDGRRVAQLETASHNNSLNLVGLQQPSDAGYNLNKVGMSEQHYVQQHNETGVFSRNNEARRDDISHGNTLSLGGFQQQCDAEYNLNKPCVNQQSYGVQHTQSGAYSKSDEAGQERVSYGNSLSLASVQQACESSYGMNKGCVQQTCDTGYSMNKGYLETVQGMSKIDELGPSRDRDLMIGFGNGGGRSGQVPATDFLWRSTEGNTLPGNLVDSTSSHGQSSGSFQAFDFLSDKSGSSLYASNEKFNNMSSYEGLRSTVEPMEFTFMTTQESNSQLQHPKVLQYNTGMDQGFGSAVWNQRATPLPNMMAGNVVSTLCVWCGNQFHQDSLSCEMQAGSIGFLCPTCKTRMSGQYL